MTAGAVGWFVSERQWTDGEGCMSRLRCNLFVSLGQTHRSMPVATGRQTCTNYTAHHRDGQRIHIAVSATCNFYRFSVSDTYPHPEIYRNDPSRFQANYCQFHLCTYFSLNTHNAYIQLIEYINSNNLGRNKCLT